MLTLSILAAPRFRARVEVVIPAEDGSTETTSFTAIFKVLDTETTNAFVVTTTEGTHAFLDAALAGWDDVVDDDGAPVPFAPAVKEGLIRSPLAVQPLYAAYYDGLRQARRGN